MLRIGGGLGDKAGLRLGGDWGLGGSVLTVTGLRGGLGLGKGAEGDDRLSPQVPKTWKGHA